MYSPNYPKIRSQHKQSCSWGRTILRVYAVETVLVLDVFDFLGSLEIAGVVEVVGQVETEHEHAAAVVEYLAHILPL